MSRVARKQTVNKQMYRHFAVITVLLTLVLAIFADGSNRESLTDRMRNERQRAQLEDADARMFGKHKLGGTDGSGRMPGSDGGSGGGGEDGDASAEDGGTDASGPRTARTSIGPVSDANGDGQPDYVPFFDDGVMQLPTRAGVIVKGGRSLPPGIGPLPPKSGQLSGTKQGKPGGVKPAPSAARREQLVNSGFQDAGAPSQ
ncbi:MAG: hypothetical protein ABI673_07420 [Novosphingobium sp.]